MRGFTLFEVLIAFALLAIIAGFMLNVSFSSLGRDSFYDERETLVSLLEHARSLAISGICEGNSCLSGAAHGVEIFQDSYVLFQGESYISRDKSYDAVFQSDAAITKSGATEMVFQPLSADVATTGQVVLSKAGNKESIISIDSEGQISWTP